MIKLGIVKNVIDDKTIQIIDLEDDEIYKVQGDVFCIDSIKNFLSDNSDPCYVEFDDKEMVIVV